VADGYSEDNTVKIAKKFGARVAMEHNRSGAWERSAAAKIAKNEVFAFIDADGFAPDDWIEKIGSEFEKNNDLGMIYGNAYMTGYSKFRNFFVVLAGYLFFESSSIIRCS